ncbi:DUF4397 domain-containing protein [Cupriavidus necator]|uniref:DUF4397 domain-containing protein n=1 Tax=Cupriavidus necator (strain ATCC 17699 / DSM 428 / KCTC 22496 / NCIMB 10442 / H16 / Stanier 337) TaxID=381666 RepID=Q0JZJ1_CUPNH|nr:MULTISPECIES: DUF4397 domain-containing protein [Cupriavidus]EON19936.1 hypothetical protein C265_11031 [Cupriavidus sp. GA3-3]KUE90610.1 hisitidine kinase [Cupriavidus necator]QCC04636.1 DUF4397 domain-containing protein [Cupriavidus necator H16]QQB79327.1 DUF4397 domain-containing protein [Cupriavidus necator]WKA43555.1 DUF4397 domain-containing protein [Cupriavidus necator]
MFRSKTLFIGLALAATAVLTACGGGDDGIDDRIGLSKPTIRVIHAITGGPNVDVLQNGTLTSFVNKPYKFVSTYFNVETGNQLISFNTAGTQTELGRATLTAATGHKYTVVALPGASSAETLTIDDPFEKGLLSHKARVRSLNASFNAQNIDIYLTLPAIDLNSVGPTFANVGYKQAVPASGTDSIDVDGNTTYRLRITTAGTKTVIFDSGALTLANNADWLITTIPVDGIAGLTPNKIKVLVARGDDESQAGLELVTQ